MTIALVLAHGSFIFLGAILVALAGIVIGYFTRIGSGINPRPYGNIYGGAPGAFGPGNVSGRDDREHVPWSRGTR